MSGGGTGAFVLRALFNGVARAPVWLSRFFNDHHDDHEVISRTPNGIHYIIHCTIKAIYIIPARVLRIILLYASRASTAGTYTLCTRLYISCSGVTDEEEEEEENGWTSMDQNSTIIVKRARDIPRPKLYVQFIIKRKKKIWFITSSNARTYAYKYEYFP